MTLEVSRACILSLLQTCWADIDPDWCLQSACFWTLAWVWFPAIRPAFLIFRTARVMWDAPQNAVQTVNQPRPSGPPSLKLLEGRL